MAVESYRASSTAGSERVNHCWREVDAQHAFDAHGTAARSGRLRVHRLDHRAQFRPHDNLVHLGEKHLAARRLAKGLKPMGCGESQLVHQ
jgi:hypothetical protein